MEQDIYFIVLPELAPMKKERETKMKPKSQKIINQMIQINKYSTKKSRSEREDWGAIKIPGTVSSKKSGQNMKGEMQNQTHRQDRVVTL